MVLKASMVFWYAISRIKMMECLKKARFHSFCKHSMRSKSTHGLCSLFFGVSTRFYERSSRSDMIIDDEDILTFKISTLEVHFDLIRSLSHFRARYHFKVSEES